MEKLFYYNPKIDKKVVKVVGEVLGIQVKKAVKLKHGEVNHVYKVLLADNTRVVVKVFKNKHWPEKAKLSWIEKQMQKYKIPHAKILFYDRSSKYFPAGFVVSEFIHGTNGQVAVQTGKLSLAQAFVKIGEVLSKIHKIRIKRYGQIRNGKGEDTDFLKYKLYQARKSFRHLTAKGVIDDTTFYRVKEAVSNILEANKKLFLPVLTHRDASRENAIYGKDGQWYIIDWDNAKAGIWLEDYAELTFWADWRRAKNVAKQRYKIIQKNFFKGYGKVKIAQKQILQIEYALHVLKCAEMLSYYYFNKKNLREFGLVKKKLHRLLKINSKME